jgi:hypothetical protein
MQFDPKHLHIAKGIRERAELAEWSAHHLEWVFWIFV